MKKVFAILLTIFTTLAVSGQTFEGKIVYKNTFKSKNPQITDQQLNSMMGSTQEYFIKDGDYKSSTNGTFFQWQLYINKDNKLYNKMSNSATVFWIDASINADSVLKAELNKNVTEILGYKCDELILTCKSGIQKYYFNSQLSVDTKLFINHKYGNWFFYLSKTNALPLKSIIDTDQFTMESVAMEIKPMKLDQKLFALPPDTKIDKSPY